MSPTLGSTSTSADLQKAIDNLERQLAERTAERDEALARETATAEVLGVINSSPGDLAPVFDSMLEKAMRLCDGASGVIWTFDGERLHFAGSRGHAPETVELLRHQGEAGEHPLLNRVLGGEHVLQVYLRDHEIYQLGGALDQVPAVTGMQTVLWVAMVDQGNVVGVFGIGRQEARPFADKEVALLQNFAAQAVIAMENARLLTETREALEQQTATAEVLGVINSSPGDIAPVFRSMLESAARLCDASHGILGMYEGDGFRGVATVGFTQEAADGLSTVRNPPPGTTLARAQELKQTVQIADISLERGFAPVFAANPSLRTARTNLVVPMLKEGQLVGAILVYREVVRPFTDRQIALLENFAAQAVIAIENARLLDELRQKTNQVAELNRGLEARVSAQVEELGRVGRLKRFLAPQLAELIVSQGDEKILESHRREIVVVFCDLRGYTAFTETAEPEEVLDFLREYHGALGPLVSQFEGTLDQFSGDGIMVFFNDPVPVPDPAERAVRMAVAMREAAGALIAHWRERGRDLGFGAGIAQGYATLGQIGFSERSGYTAIGTVCNVAARLCAEAKDGQILLSQRVNAAIKGGVATEQVGALALKGLAQPVVAFNVTPNAVQPAFRAIEGGAPTD